MTEDNSIVRLRQPEEIDDPLTTLLRSGARQLLEQAIEAEVAAFLVSMRDLKLADGRDRLVRHGPERVIQTGIGPVEVQRVKVRDRAAGPAAKRIRFSSALLPRWARRTTSLDALLPILYLRQRVAWRRKRQKWPHPLRLVRRRGRSPGVQDRAFG